MKVNYIFRNFQLGQWQKDEVNKKLERLNKYFNEDLEAKVTIDKIGEEIIVEVTIFLPGTVIRAEEGTDDLLTSVDRVVDALVSQIRKYKTKLQNKYQKNESIRFESFEDDREDDIKDDSPKIVRVKRFGIKPMSPEEAILQMELVGHDFFVFQDAETFETSVVYKRRNGNYGLIEPELE